MFHVGAFYESVAPNDTLQLIAAVREEMFYASGDDLRVPSGLANLIGETALCAAVTARAQVQSPSLRAVANLDVEPLVSGAVIFGSPPESIMHPEAPIPLQADEALNFTVNAATGAAAAHYGVVFLADGMPQPVTGPMIQLYCSGSITQVAGVWTNGALTFGQTLPAGRYAVVGMRARAATGVAARLVFPEQVARPGCLLVNAIGDHDPYWFRVGRLGVWGEFPHTNPPSVDILGGTATAQFFVLDLIRTK